MQTVVLLSTLIRFPPFVALVLAACSAYALDPVLVGYDPSGLIRFADVVEGENRREELLQFIWADGFPTSRPQVTKDIPFPSELTGVYQGLTARVDRYDIDVSGYGFFSTAYVIYPVNPTSQPRLAIMHAGHVPDRPDLYLNGGLDDTISVLLERGLIVAAMQMPVTGWNRDAEGALPTGEEFSFSSRGTAGHREMFADLGVTLQGGVFRFFLEPITQVINEFVARYPGYQDITMTGLSGGGWATHMAAAIDVRIDLSIPVAGALPLYARPFSPGSAGDTEQDYAPLFREIDSEDADSIPDQADGVASWLEIFALGALSPDPAHPRRQVQVLNFMDSCCFSTDVYQTYDGYLSNLVHNIGAGQWELFSDRSHSSHIISPLVLTNVIGANVEPSPRPERPVNRTPRATQSVMFPADFQASPYDYASNPPVAHGSTIWRIRSAGGSYSEPVIVVTSSGPLTQLPIPFEALTLGEVYYWQCFYTDANGNVSPPSLETPFSYGQTEDPMTIVPMNSVQEWKYLEPGQALDSNWVQPGYDDSGWRSGVGLFGVATASLFHPIRTPLVFGQTTYYFRTRFHFDHDVRGALLQLTALVDDGAIVYLNGKEVWRNRMSPGLANDDSPALGSVEDATLEGPFIIPDASLVRGTNVLAVEVHQADPHGADVVFGLSLAGTPTSAPQGPTVLVHPQSQVVEKGGEVYFSVSARGLGQLAFQWYRDGVPIVGGTNDVLTSTQADLLQAGDYTVSVTDEVDSIMSQPGTLIVRVPSEFSEHPQSQTVYVGDTVTFFVEVSPWHPSISTAYRYRRNGRTVLRSGEVWGGPSLTLRDVQLSESGVKYSVVATNAGERTGILSRNAVLTVVEIEDVDGDRLPDDWEREHGLDPNDAGDRDLDRDGDGASNADEFAAGTDPRDPDSHLKLTATVVDPVGVKLEFEAVSNIIYSVEWRESQALGEWLKWTDVVQTNQSVERITLTDTRPSADSRLYRLTTPRRVNPTPGPVILQSPTSRLVDIGGEARFEVSAVGTGSMAFEWFVDGRAIRGANQATLRLPDVQLEHVGAYTVRIRDQQGWTVVVMPAILAVRPQILDQPQDQGVRAGETALLSVSATGHAPLRYTWFRDEEMIPGASGPDLVLHNVAPADAGVYEVIVSHDTPLGRAGTRSRRVMLKVE